MKKITLLFLSALTLFSCGKSKQTNSEIVSSELEDVILSNDNKVYLHDVVCDIETIPLESSDKVLVGDISNIIMTDEHIIVYSRHSSPMVVHVFDRNGKHISTINRIGRGPQEYAAIHHVALLPDNETIVINDTHTCKILFFSLDGQFISSIPAPFGFLSMEYIDENNVICGTYGMGESDPGLADRDNRENIAYFTDGKYNIQSSFLPKRYDKERFRYNTHNLKKFDNDIYININYTDIFYKVEDHGLKAMYRLNLDKIEGVAILKPDITNEEFNQLMREKTVFPGFFIVSDDYLTFSVLEPGMLFTTYLYSKKTKKVYHIEKDRKYCDDLLVNLIGPFHTQSKRRFVTHIQAQYIANKGEEFFKQRPELAGIKEDDNPVIVLYSFKEGL